MLSWAARSELPLLNIHPLMRCSRSPGKLMARATWYGLYALEQEAPSSPACGAA